MATTWGRMHDVVRRHRRVVLGSVATAVALVALWSYLTPKRWEAATTVRLDPVVVAGLRQDGGSPTPPEQAEAVALELAAAGGAPFRDGIALDQSYPYDFVVTADPDEATLTFTATADSSERAYAGSYSAANGFIAWGRAQEVVGRQAQLERDLAAAAAPGAPELADLTARLEVATAAVEELSAGGGEVVVEPSLPHDPVSPDLTRRLLVAASVGLAVGVALAVGRDQRRGGRTSVDDPPRVEVAPSPPHRPARMLLGTAVVLGMAIPAAAAIAGVVGVWELRPTTNAQDEAGYACLPTWLDDLPDDTTVAMSGASPRFFYDHLQEFAFPRLELPAPGAQPEVLLTIVPGPGPDACGGFHREITRP